MIKESRTKKLLLPLQYVYIVQNLWIEQLNVYDVPNSQWIGIYYGGSAMELWDESEHRPGQLNAVQINFKNPCDCDWGFVPFSRKLSSHLPGLAVHCQKCGVCVVFYLAFCVAF